eukprot:CAMPEP_0196594316 /NCGR_PEP_ID=MMETSP1081-20130531/77998_1 /TAXON_ID=36882 /ORGANISM="Pyramimonas amylifera, Strain CCMP720" /LENGTH=288 /DNA_ID=CAMNT_0041918547 /DNA_START=51 /DNA_END=917 /DNA_ORIENTATION=+
MTAAAMDNFMSQVDVDALKMYVSAEGKAGGAYQCESTVLLWVSHSNLQAQFMEIRFDRHTIIKRVKERLQSHCGTSPLSMMLTLRDDSGRTLCALDQDDRMLGYYSPKDGWGIHVQDNDPFSLSKGGWLEDTALVEKYKISDEDYNNRKDTYRKFKEKNIAEDPSWTIEKEMAKKRGGEYRAPEVTTDPDFMSELVANVEVGHRCEVDPGGKRGVVKFIGKAGEGLPLGYWLGVQYDEPVGKNDGSVKGVRYFDCPQGYGGMLRPNKVKIGDYPPLDDLDSDFSADEI